MVSESLCWVLQETLVVKDAAAVGWGGVSGRRWGAWEPEAAEAGGGCPHAPSHRRHRAANSGATNSLISGQDAIKTLAACQSPAHLLGISSRELLNSQAEASAIPSHSIMAQD